MKQLNDGFHNRCLLRVEPSIADAHAMTMVTYFSIMAVLVGKDRWRQPRYGFLSPVGRLTFRKSGVACAAPVSAFTCTR